MAIIHADLPAVQPDRRHASLLAAARRRRRRRALFTVLVVIPAVVVAGVWRIAKGVVWRRVGRLPAARSLKGRRNADRPKL